MNYEAVLHIPLSNYAHGIDEENVVFRIRTARDDIKSCILHYGDRACRVNPVIFNSEPMKIVAQDELYDYYEVVLHSPYTRICYYFELSDGVESKYYYYDMFMNTLPIERSEFYQLPFNRREDIATIPSWVQDAVVYNIFPDSFATAKGYISNKKGEAKFSHHTTYSMRGGTLKGIKENIPYFLDLGVNCIYMNPIFVAGEWHKYDLIGYYNIDPCFGTNEDFKELVDACHDNDIRVIIDGVFNHCGWHFFAFEDVLEKGEASKYKDWFYGLKYPVEYPDNQEDIPTYDCFAYERKMPKMNTSNKEVIEYFLDVCKYWTESYGIDGWRLDVASEVDDTFWREFRKTAKSINPDCFIIGEVWESAQHWLLGDQFDSSMNYDMRKNCRDFFAVDALDSYGFDSRVTAMLMRYNKNIVHGQLNLLDSHDVPRFLSICQEDMKRFKLSVIFQMTFLGVPMVFYGDEKGLVGIKEHEYRRPMSWDKEEGAEIYSFYQDIIKLRRNKDTLKYGDYKTIMAERNSGVYAFKRCHDDEETYVILNRSEESIAIDNVIGDTNYNIDLSSNEDCKMVEPWGFVIVSKSC